MLLFLWGQWVTYATMKTMTSNSACIRLVDPRWSFDAVRQPPEMNGVIESSIRCVPASVKCCGESAAQLSIVRDLLSCTRVKMQPADPNSAMWLPHVLNSPLSVDIR